MELFPLEKGRLRVLATCLLFGARTLLLGEGAPLQALEYAGGLQEASQRCADDEGEGRGEGDVQRGLPKDEVLQGGRGAGGNSEAEGEVQKV